MVVEKRKEFKEFEEFKERSQNPGGGSRGACLPAAAGRRAPRLVPPNSSPELLYRLLPIRFAAAGRVANRPRV
jgi:hypothetical protein